jgi:hypothetical protein
LQQTARETYGSHSEKIVNKNAGSHVDLRILSYLLLILEAEIKNIHLNS